MRLGILTGAAIDPRIMGSAFVLRAKQGTNLGQFDYADLFASKVAFIQLRETALFCVLDDACGAFTMLKDGLMTKIAGSLSPIQLS